MALQAKVFQFLLQRGGVGVWNFSRSHHHQKPRPQVREAVNVVLQLVITFKRDTRKLESVTTSTIKGLKSKIYNKVGLFILVKGRLVGESGA